MFTEVKESHLQNGDLEKKKVSNFIPQEELKTGHVEGSKAYLPITKGCNNYCSYCVVPNTRGRLVCREPANILEEAKNLIEKGAVEITLLGQNVNAYQVGNTGFFELLEAMTKLDRLKRLRFISPHPNAWNNSLTDLMSQSRVICNQLHLPFQSGSDRILKLMNRRHTCVEYLEKIDFLKHKIPKIDIGTDVIVGFPGETDQDFEETMKVLEYVRFSQLYAFKYSTRPGTKASEYIEDEIPKNVKEERLKRVLDFQAEQQSKLLESCVGNILEVLIDSAHPRERYAMKGRTQGYLPVTIPNSELEIGDLVKVKIVGKKTHSLVGSQA